MDSTYVSIGLDPSKYPGHEFRSLGAADRVTVREPFGIKTRMGWWNSVSSCRLYLEMIWTLQMLCPKPLK